LRPVWFCAKSNPGVTPTEIEKGLAFANPLIILVRPERFELPTPWFVAKYSIQMSYGRFVYIYDATSF
jgi:hypothetical protein